MCDPLTSMNHTSIYNLCILLCILSLIVGGLPCSRGNMIDSKILNVGVELLKETLPLQMGSRLYQLQGLKSDIWYEVKISYPASIPSRFSIQLRRGNSDLGLTQKRKLLNTEKLIFNIDSLDSHSDQGGIYVLVTVEPDGVVALRHGQEQKYAVFNIVCDELLLGIPHKAWWVVILVVVCLGAAFVIPRFLPAYLLRKNCGSEVAHRIVSKDS